MRILFILDEFFPENNGGAATIAFTLAKGLKELGHDLLVLTATHDAKNVEDDEIEGLKIKRIFTKPFGKFRNLKNIRNNNILAETEKIFEKYNPDIIHIHSLHHRFSYGVIGLSKRFSRAVFLTLHDAQTIYNGKLFPKIKTCDLNPAQNYKITWIDRFKKDKYAYNPFQIFFIKRALKRADKIFAVSDALKKTLEANGIFNIEVIHNGIAVDERSNNEIIENNVLFAGRVDKAKGVENLINSFNIISLEIPDAKLIIVGDGNFKTEKNENIKILPWQNREEMKKIFSQAKVVIVPSIYLDPFPTVNLEAMAAEKPVVGTCFGGTPEIVLNNETGYIVNPHDEKELAGKIIDLLKNADRTKLFGENGRKRIEKYFSLGKQIYETLIWYNKFL